MPFVVRSAFWAATLAFVVAAGGASCTDIVDTSLPRDSSVSEVIVSPPSIILAVGAKTTLVASVRGGPDLFDRTVTWSSSDTAVAMVDSTGNVIALAGGRATIIASAHAHPQVTGEAIVSVVPSAVPLSLNQSFR